MFFVLRSMAYVLVKLAASVCLQLSMYMQKKKVHTFRFGSLLVIALTVYTERPTSHHEFSTRCIQLL